MMPIHHFFHVWADGDWGAPVKDHIQALKQGGLADALDSFQIGIVGCPDNRERVKTYLRTIDTPWTTCAESDSGWEQETLTPMWQFSQDHDGLGYYAHTKGSANFAPVNAPWRRSMEWYNTIQWQLPRTTLEQGRYAAGCHWHSAGPAPDPSNGTGGMFGGNYWWVRLDKLRQNVPPQMHTRFAAEHWIGQLSEIMPVTAETFLDMCPGPIAVGHLHDVW